MFNIIFWIIIGILLFDFLFSRILDYINDSKRNDKIPDALQGLYDEEKYNKSQKYGAINSKFSLITGSFNLILILAMLFFGGFAYFDSIAKDINISPIWSALIFFGMLYFLADILNMPFSYYHTFVIEEKFGFNKTSKKTFFMDKLKGWFLAIVLGGGIMALIIWLYYETTNMFWIYAWIAVSVFSIFMATFYSNLIVPLFNKQKPLEESPLRNAISNFSKKADFKLDNIYVIDGSKRSSKANAYFTGLGKKKRIVLYDTLIHDLDTDEIVAVLAHEIGHYKLKHTLYSMILSIIQSGVIFYILSLFIGNQYLSEALGAANPSFELSIIAFGILFSPISSIIELFMNMFSRKNEYQADHFAGKFDLAVNLINALKKLSVNNLSNLTPHPAYVFVHYSHPTLYQRMMALETNSTNILK